MFPFTWCLILDSTPIPLEMFLLNSCKYGFQFKLESKMSLRYLTWLSDLTDILEILRFNLWAIRLCGEWNTTKLVFSMFRDNLLANNHWLTLSSSTFRLVSKFRMLVLSRNRFVSSAKRWKSKMLEHLGRSFIYKRKRSGPSTDPCGTPHETVW